MSERSELADKVVKELQSWGWTANQTLVFNEGGRSKHRLVSFSLPNHQRGGYYVDGVIHIYNVDYIIPRLHTPADNDLIDNGQRHWDITNIMDDLADIRDEVEEQIAIDHLNNRDSYDNRDKRAIEVLDNSVAADPERHVPNEGQLAFMRSIALDGILNNPRESSLHKLALLLGCTIDEIHTAQTIGLERRNA